MIREMVRIDEDKCDGCGLCVPSCAEGAIQIIDGKAKLLSDNLCDGLGACLGDCPQDAITIEKREAEAFDEEVVNDHLKAIGREPIAHEAPASKPVPSAAPAQGGCPSARLMNFDRPTTEAPQQGAARQSELRQWPVQLNLLPPTAPVFQDADLLICADCVPFAYADFHKDYLQGRALAIGCPKLDDGQAYLDKLTAIFAQNNIRSISVAHMEVPCCTGLIVMAKQALAASGKDIPLETIRFGVQGDLK